MRSIELSWMYRILMILLVGGLIACSPEENGGEVTPPDKIDEGYFIEVTKTKNLNKALLVSDFGIDGTNPLLLLLPEKQLKTEAIRYMSKDPAGKPLEVSGIITYPAEGECKGLVIGQHYTIGADRESPSALMVTAESLLAFFGYAVAVPDYIGFGATVDLPQTYIHAESAGQVSCDMFFAAREYLSLIKRPVEREAYVVGYSQGGYAALAFQQMAERQYADKIKLLRAFAGGGPYLPESIFDHFMQQDEVANPATILLTIVGADYADGLKLDYTKIFLEPVLSSYREWCVSKKYTLGEINHLLPSNRLSDWLHPDFFTENHNEEIRKLKGSLVKNNLIDWVPRAPILLAHSTLDETVPFSNTEAAYKAFQKAGTSVELHTSKLDHSSAAIPFYLLVLQALK
ncbi:pimeloyl-ACP methyl ester carboxylesterase [Parabacteroides sp. PFB2-10]|uniref:alpha/beta hydrolase family protein n=1 Tax=Parabacteroides sp. PFB2-10 TaxID=1742405 RepID=UPI00247697B7|nr:lipase family protein [Parabacteroides sp. PFB2-10]MDH6313293.1 pimeloyl-ACP methyl ester carboxylesterase [Parabacteroides sp. PFB2-10]MDL2245783.1 lipase family protein [Parabacteroides sp. OttesenSCG-928-J18]